MLSGTDTEPEAGAEAETEAEPEAEAGPKTIYGGLVQPSPLVLFSSLPVSSPFQHASLSIDKDLTADSFIALLDDRTSQPVQIPSSSTHEPPAVALYRAKTKDHATDQDVQPLNPQDQSSLTPIRSVVLHIQSPNTKFTFIRIPPVDHYQTDLDIELGFIHLQIKPLGHHFMFEIGLKDDSGTLLRLRCSTFQTEAKEYPATENRSKLLHIPLIFPPITSSTQTNWLEIMVPLSRIWSKYKSTSFISVHANIRLRRIYFSDDGCVRFEKKKNIRVINDRPVVVVGGAGGKDLEKDEEVVVERPELVLFSGDVGS